MIDTDSAYYGNIARLFASGHWQKALDPYWPPFFPFLASLLFRLGLPLEASGIIVSLLASAGSVLVCFFLGRLLAGDRVAVTAAVLAAIHPRLIAMAQSFLTEPLYMFLSSAALILFCLVYDDPSQKAKKRMALRFFSVGFLLSFAFLTRPEGIFFILLALVLLAWSLVLEPALKKSTSPKNLAVNVLLLILVLVAFLMPSFPYIHRVTKLQGRLTLGEKAEANFYGAYKDEYQKAGIPIELSDYASITGPETARRPGNYHIFQFMRQCPGKILLRASQNIPRALLDKMPSLMYWPLMFLSLVGLITRRKTKRSSMDLIFGLWVLVPVVIFSPLFLYRRFFSAALPPLIAWGAVGLEELRRFVPRKIFRILVGVGIILLLVMANSDLSRQSWPILYKDAGRWLKTRAEKPAILSGRKPEMSFYADAEFRPLKAQNEEDLFSFLKKENITHLVVEDYILPASHPQLAYLLNPKDAPSWLDPVYSAAKKGHTLIIYKFQGHNHSFSPS